MKTHGPNSPQTVRGLRERRKLRGVLDTRWKNEADVTTAPMAAPFGKAFSKIKSPNGTEYVVANQSLMTFAPGTKVLIAVPEGGTGRAVIGGAPAGKKGGVSRTVSPRRRGSVAAEVPDQYAFATTGGNLIAMLYQDGTYVSTRATITEPSTELVCGIILTDPGLLVGDGSALLSDGEYGTSVLVWDVDGVTTYTYTCAAGWMLAAWPVYHAGAVYILEVEDGTGIVGHADATMDFRLRTAAADLTGDTTIATITMTATDYDQGNGMDHYHSDSYEHGALMVDDDHAVVYMYVRHHEPGHGVIQRQSYQYRITLAGGAESHRDYRLDTYDLQSLYCATLSGTSFIAHGGTEVYAKADDASTQATLLDSGLTGTAAAINTAPNGTTWQVFNVTAGVPDGIWRNGNIVTATVDSFDTVNYPEQMFYFGDL